MNKVYRDIWELAKPYYKKGRPMDIKHIEWMMKDALHVCKKENIDETILLPVVILHDVGYGVGRHVYREKELKKEHMEAGAKIAEEILRKINYPEDKIKKIVYYISVHDNWIFGENEIYKKDKLLATFTDLDFTWMATPKGFPIVRDILKKTNKEMIEFIEKNDKLVKRPFVTKTTKELYVKYVGKLKI
jgi:hypothetical protein